MTIKEILFFPLPEIVFITCACDGDAGDANDVVCLPEVLYGACLLGRRNSKKKKKILIP